MVIVGSARSDEYGSISGGRAGDQTGHEVETQEWYLHSKGWRVLRCKDSHKRELIAKAMKDACANPHIGYDQDQNYTLWDVARNVGFDCSKVDVDCETDCARLVRVCVAYAGIIAEDFYTVSEAYELLKTGMFDEYPMAANNPDLLLRGDILVTKTKGHTVIVVEQTKQWKADDVLPDFDGVYVQA